MNQSNFLQRATPYLTFILLAGVIGWYTSPKWMKDHCSKTVQCLAGFAQRTGTLLVSHVLKVPVHNPIPQ